jgi:diguanylate cyclase (GGDEF)-like protein
VFTKVFQFYLTNVNSNEIKNNGMYELSNLNSVLNLSYVYYLLLIIIAAILSIIVVKKRKIRKDKKVQKIKYIDSLTSLKNRAYLIDNMSNWDLNKIYPKAIIIVDLNKLKEVNNNFGYDEGDLLIKKAANILISTQQDNSDIMRSDGNEFTIYMVGYQENQVVQYIRKIYKLMQDLPYEFGATLGYSMINDDVKTVEDAINEAVLDMITNKEIKANE